MRPIGYPPKQSPEEAKFRYHTGIEDSVQTSTLAERALDSSITITTRELLAASPEVRKHVKDLVVTKKVSVNNVEADSEDPVDAYLAAFVNDSPPVPLDVAKYEDSAAVHSLPLRVIYPEFAPGVQPECILDGGAQIVVMRKDVWEQLQVPLATHWTMSMESANSGTTRTLGFVENHPVKIGHIVIHLQIQVVEDAPFEVLLGRPFFDVTSCAEVSKQGGEHSIYIRDPTTQIPYLFPTQPRKFKTQKVNFQA
jgi:hypothetical protein